MEMLVDPTPNPLRDKISLGTFVEQVKPVPLETLRHRASNLCAEIEYVRVRNAFRRELETAELDGDLAEGLILAALKLGILNAYAYLPSASSCFALNSFYWHTFSPQLAHRALQTGSARLQISDLIPESIESDVANRPLFVTADAIKDLLNLRTPSKASLDRLATKIISDHQASTARKLRKQDFVSRLIRLSRLQQRARTSSLGEARAGRVAASRQASGHLIGFDQNRSVNRRAIYAPSVFLCT